MKRALGLLCVSAALEVTGCAATFTSIRRLDDGTYVVTRTKSGFMGITSGKLFQCAPAGGGMRCIEIDSP